MLPALESLQARLGHVFSDPALLREAITHPSYGHERPREGPHNQRLEFLGDSVLHLVITEALYGLYPGEPEGVLSRHRAALTKGKHLAQLALDLRLDQALLLGGSEGDEGRTRASNLEDAFEALLGALYLDAGLERTRAIVLAVYGSLPARLAVEVHDNPKGRLQERMQALHGMVPLRYDTAPIAGPDHAREYGAKVALADRVLGEGRGSSKKAAEEDAARAALASLSAITSQTAV